MKLQKIIFQNTFARGTAHEMFNASVLLMCSEHTDILNCRISKSSYQVMRNILDDRMPTNITLKKTLVIPGNSKYALLFRYLFGAFMDCLYMVFSDSKSLIIFPFNNVFSLRLVNFLSKKLGRNVLVFCHGEMEPISSDVNTSGLLSKILYFLCRNFFLNEKVVVADKLFFSVLGESVKSNLSQYIDAKKMLHFTTMDHPYIFRQSSFIYTKINKPVSMGTIGAISENKGFERLVQFALLCKESNVDVLISHTGVVNSKNKLNVGGLIDIPTLNRELPRSEYDNRLLKLDYILFFYDINSYRVTASGAIMDALAMKKPIIALKNDYFEYLFDKFGPIGFLVDDISQMVELTNKISLGLINDKFDFEGIRSRFAPDSIKHQFDDILSYIS